MITTIRSTLGAALMLSVLVAFALPAVAGEVLLEARLLWGTDSNTSPDPSHRPVPQEVLKKLRAESSPLKWTNYFEVTRKQFTITNNLPTRVELSKNCKVEVRQGPDDKMEFTLFGKGKEVVRASRVLPKGNILVMAGNAENYTSWLVVFKQPSRRWPPPTNAPALLQTNVFSCTNLPPPAVTNK